MLESAKNLHHSRRDDISYMLCTVIVESNLPLRKWNKVDSKMTTDGHGNSSSYIAKRSESKSLLGSPMR